ncbi:hypothetical protein DAEQUDRAFT_419380 [Daedalea quercina L-15889]|uniref:Uncharacterized protein n=1 Tax=Daedalea quercina L-15889 TaxID=1314783 RepID=A0A165TKD8_9APHY|nr:hypothetical protein DAEQUDRAFT_419380 [Daedalea quercina L-15889]
MPGQFSRAIHYTSLRRVQLEVCSMCPDFLLRIILHWKRLAYPTMLSNAAAAISAISMPLQ